MFLAEFQLVLEKLDLFKSHQCILTSGLLPVPVSLEPCSHMCCANGEQRCLSIMQTPDKSVLLSAIQDIPPTDLFGIMGKVE